MIHKFWVLVCGAAVLAALFFVSNLQLITFAAKIITN